MNPRQSARILAAGAAAAAVLVAGCSSGGGNQPDSTKKDDNKAGGKVSRDVAAFGTAAQSKGPAPAVAGSKDGGTVKVYDRDDFSHLDPQKVYGNWLSNVSELLNRQLTTYVERDGKTILVGDLATDTGKSSNGGKTWTYTLKDGVKWQDGKPITSADVKYGIERSFGKGFEVGPPYLQEWLTDTTNFTDAQKKYAGPKAGDLAAVTTPDAKTVVLNFPKAQSDVPFVMAMGTGSPVRKDKDTGTKYDINPFGNGPYKITKRAFNSQLVLEKNTNWDPNTDPLRHQFVDKYQWQFGLQPLNINQRLIAGNGDDATAMSTTTTLSPEVQQQVLGNPELKKQLIQTETPFVDYYVINNQRIKDVNVRTALLYAMPREQMRQVTGGAINGSFASTYSSPTLLGFQPYDIFKANPKGDPAKAKEYLKKAGVTNLKITYGYSKGPRGEQVAQALVAGMKKSGITVIPKPVDPANYYDEIGKPDSTIDLSGYGWAADWPNPSTVMPVILDGRQGFTNDQSRFNDPETNKEFDRIAKIGDAATKAKELFALEQKVMKKVPMIPDTYVRYNQLHGKGLGGVHTLPSNGLNSLDGVFIKD